MECPIYLTDTKCSFEDCIDNVIQDIEKQISDKYDISLNVFDDLMAQDVCFICNVNKKTTPACLNCPACQFRYLMEEDIDTIKKEFPKYKSYFLLSKNFKCSCIRKKFIITD